MEFNKKLIFNVIGLSVILLLSLFYFLYAREIFIFLDSIEFGLWLIILLFFAIIFAIIMELRIKFHKENEST